MRAVLLGLVVCLAIPAQAAELAGPGWRLEAGPELRAAGAVNGWTLLRDAAAPADAEEYGLLMLRVQRPVPPEAGPRHLAASLRALRPFRFQALPVPERARQAGLPATILEVPARRATTGAALRLRAVLVHAPDRSFLIVASAPEAAWPGLQAAMLAALASFAPRP